MCLATGIPKLLYRVRKYYILFDNRIFLRASKQLSFYLNSAYIINALFK